jgi:hypothetical protein
MMVFAVATKEIVAGASEGAGAAEVVWVRENALRDLSRKSAIAYSTSQS